MDPDGSRVHKNSEGGTQSPDQLLYELLLPACHRSIGPARATFAGRVIAKPPQNRMIKEETLRSLF